MISDAYLPETLRAGADALARRGELNPQEQSELEEHLYNDVAAVLDAVSYGLLVARNHSCEMALRVARAELAEAHKLIQQLLAAECDRRLEQRSLAEHDRQAEIGAGLSVPRGCCWGVGHAQS